MPVILLISDVIPEESAGGELILYRHLTRLKASELSWDLHVAVTDEKKGLPEGCQQHRFHRLKIPSRLFRTRLAPILYRLQYQFRIFSRISLGKLVRKLQPDVILTVAHGTLYQIALELARDSRIPLVTFFHDWWPDLAHCSPSTRAILSRDFHTLFRASTASLCVCEGMLREFPAPENGCVLYPIPNDSNLPLEVLKSEPIRAKITRIGYSGTLAGEYGEMVVGLARRLYANPFIEFQFSGPNQSESDEAFELGYRGFLSPQDYRAFLPKHDILLVTMSFSEADKRRSRTSLPSKIPEYLKTGIPILVWAPEHSTAVQWANASEAAVAVTSRDPSTVEHSISALAGDRERLAEISRKGHEEYTRNFLPASIQSQFEKIIEDAARV